VLTRDVAYEDTPYKADLLMSFLRPDEELRREIVEGVVRDVDRLGYDIDDVPIPGPPD
jgi:hypothetical protein